LFAGAFLDGSTLRPDHDANHRLYNRSVTTKEIVLDGKVAPLEARHHNRVKHCHLRSGFKLLGPNRELTLGAAIYEAPSLRTEIAGV
jgi:hypothetical protein